MWKYDIVDNLLNSATKQKLRSIRMLTEMKIKALINRLKISSVGIVTDHKLNLS